jgi:hypothetical protein
MPGTTGHISLGTDAQGNFIIENPTFNLRIMGSGNTVPSMATLSLDVL